jgi:uncharacterized sporulation protein YeaH/YhbH (DUF444 family)
MSDKLKKADFIRNSKDQRFNQSVLRMLKRSWNDVVNDPKLISVDHFSSKQLNTLASMNLNTFTKKAVCLNHQSSVGEDVIYVFSFLLHDMRKELESML